MQKFLKIAHRGYSEIFPENTIPAFLKAVEFGADMIEFDVHLTKDSYVVVIHDNDVDRTSNGSGAVKDFTLKELKKLNFNFLKITELGIIEIPTLEEVIETIPSHVMLNIEIKNLPHQYEGIEKIIVDILEKKDCLDRVLISSFDHYALVRIKKINSKIKTGMLYEGGWLFFEEEVRQLEVYSIHPAIDTIDINQLRWARSQEKKVFPWVAKSKKEIEFLKINNIADGVMVNDLTLF